MTMLKGPYTDVRMLCDGTERYAIRDDVGDSICNNVSAEHVDALLRLLNGPEPERDFNTELNRAYEAGKAEVHDRRFEAAKAAMQGRLSCVRGMSVKEAARGAVEYADALLAALDKKDVEK